VIVVVGNRVVVETVVPRVVAEPRAVVVVDDEVVTVVLLIVTVGVDVILIAVAVTVVILSLGGVGYVLRQLRRYRFIRRCLFDAGRWLGLPAQQEVDDLLADSLVLQVEDILDRKHECHIVGDDGVDDCLVA